MGEDEAARKLIPGPWLPNPVNDNTVGGAGGWAPIKGGGAQPQPDYGESVVWPEWPERKKIEEKQPEDEHGGGGGGRGGPPGGAGGGAAQPGKIMSSEHELARVLAGKLREDYRYVLDWKQGVFWDGKQWMLDLQEAQVTEQARENNAVVASSQVMSTARAILSKKGIDATADLAMKDPRLVARSKLFEGTSQQLFNAPNGIYDLPSGRVGPHVRAAFLMHMAAVAPVDAEGRPCDCPRFKKFVLDFCCGDPKFVDYIQRLGGYCLSGYVHRPAIFYFYGPQGGEGKTLLIKMLTEAMGDYAVPATIGMFEKTPSERHLTEIAVLKGARCVNASEVSGRLDEAKLKLLTGGDRIAARLSRQDSTPQAMNMKLLMSGNSKPQLDNPDKALRERFHLLPAEYKVPDAIKDKYFEDKLRQELPGILNWMLIGARLYFEYDLCPPPVVVNATNDYFFEQNQVERFLKARCERVSADDERQPIQSSTKVWKAFRKWQDKVGERGFSQNTFSERLKLVDGIRPARDMKTRGWRGFVLITLDEDDEGELEV